MPSKNISRYKAVFPDRRQQNGDRPLQNIDKIRTSKDTMQLELAKKILDLAYDCDRICPDYDEVEIRSYCGRGARKETTGIVGLSLTQVLRLIIENANEFVDEEGDPLFQNVGNLSTDSMGLSTIIY